MASEKIQKVIGIIVGIGVVILGIYLIANYIGSRHWTGVVNTGEGKQSISKVNSFKTLEDCREWAEGVVADENLAEGEWDYGCGRDCKNDSKTYQINDYECAEIVGKGEDINYEDEETVEESAASGISEQEAIDIAENSDCVEDGSLTGNNFYNEVTKTWWLDLDIEKEGCNPACVVYEQNKATEINWRCTGLLQE